MSVFCPFWYASGAQVVKRKSVYHSSGDFCAVNMRCMFWNFLNERYTIDVRIHHSNSRYELVWKTGKLRSNKNEAFDLVFGESE